MAKGEADEAEGRRTAHATFLKNFREAEATSLGQLESNIWQQAQEDWRASAWLLSRKLPNQYGDADRIVMQRAALELLDFAQRRCRPEVYEGLLLALQEHGDEDLALPPPAP